MNINDFTQSQANYIYPTSNYNAPLVHASHAEWLEAGSLRYQINVAMHNLTIEQLKDLLETVKEPKCFTESGEK